MDVPRTAVPTQRRLPGNPEVSRIHARRSFQPGGVTFRVKSEVSDGKLNLRDGPGMRHAIIVEMPVGALLRQIGACTGSDDGVTRDPWCNVDWNGTKGWASSSGLEKVQDAKNFKRRRCPKF